MQRFLLSFSALVLVSSAVFAQVTPGSLNAPIPSGLNANPALLNQGAPMVKPVPPANNNNAIDALAAAPPANGNNPPPAGNGGVVPPVAPPVNPAPPPAPPANPNAGGGNGNNVPPVVPPAAPPAGNGGVVPPANPPAVPPANPAAPVPPAVGNGAQVVPGNIPGLGAGVNAVDKQALIAKLKMALAHLEQLLAQTQDPVEQDKIKKRIQKLKDILAQLI